MNPCPVRSWCSEYRRGLADGLIAGAVLACLILMFMEAL